MGRPRVLFADDYEPMHSVVRRILEPEFEVVATVSDGWALVEAAQAKNPDVLLVDITMPGLGGIEAVRELRKAERPWAVVFLTTHNDPALIEQAFAAGGLGYVLKDEAGEHLLPAVCQALEGRSYISPSATR